MSASGSWLAPPATSFGPLLSCPSQHPRRPGGILRPDAQAEALGRARPLGYPGAQRVSYGKQGMETRLPGKEPGEEQGRGLGERRAGGLVNSSAGCGEHRGASPWPGGVRLTAWARAASTDCSASPRRSRPLRALRRQQARGSGPVTTLPSLPSTPSPCLLPSPPLDPL